MNNRRSFLRNIAGAVAGFAILPPATTYARIWRAARPAPVPVTYTVIPFWTQTECGQRRLSPEYLAALNLMVENQNEKLFGGNFFLGVPLESQWPAKV
jgi:hypothetical protein